MAVQDDPVQASPAPAVEPAASAPVKKLVAKSQASMPEVVIARSAPEKVLSALEKLISDATALTNNSVHLSSFVTTLTMYVRMMAPGIIVTPADGAGYNRSLWMALSYLLEHVPASEFRVIWSVFLGFFQEHLDRCFSPRYAYRFESHHQDEVQCQALHALLNLASLTCNPATRAEGMKQVSLEKTLSSSAFSETARQRLIAFYRT